MPFGLNQSGGLLPALLTSRLRKLNPKGCVRVTGGDAGLIYRLAPLPWSPGLSARGNKWNEPGPTGCWVLRPS